MTITIQDITNYFGLSSTESLQMLVKWISLSQSQNYPQKSEQMCAPNGIQLDAGQFAYVTLKSGTGKHVFSAYLFADSATSFRHTNYHRIALTHYLMFGKTCKDKVSDVFQAYRKADETVTTEESLPRQQRLENLAKRSNGSYEKFLGLAKAHELINGFDKKQVAEIRNFWDSWILSQQTQQAPQTSFPAQSPFSGQQQPIQIASGPLQSPFAAQQPIQAPMAPQMAPQAQATQVTLQSIYNLLQQFLMANTAQVSAKAP
ncbi:hypothetical protein [Fibrobacter sp.]|uniref:hypothetical protein n=1 Tax=Fibrobacter sp. TaxID=35828 RepID=UPI0026171F76|nr:hypothetical protein [Fibrobacter sp.]MDD5942031.1 hypothetical protein [Fibrobacter sp.]